MRSTVVSPPREANDRGTPDQRVRILCVVPSLVGGGAERQMVLLLRHLDRERFDPILCLFERSGPFLSDVPADVPVIDLGKRSKFDVPKLIWRLANVIRRAKPDVIYSKIDYANVVSTAAAGIARRRARLILGEESNQREELQHVSWPKVRRAALRWAYRRADLVVTPSEGIRRNLAADIGLRRLATTAIPNMVDAREVEQLAKEKVGHPFLEDARPLIVGMGRLTTAKGFSDLLRAFHLLRETHDCNLLILGTGPELRSLEELARSLEIDSRVAFPGFQRNPYPFIARADAFALSSLWESFGNVLIEVMSLGKPIVSTRAPYGPADILSDETAMLVEPGNPKAFAGALRTVIEDPRMAQKLGTAARAASRAFDTSSVIARYEEAFSQRPVVASVRGTH